MNTHLHPQFFLQHILLRRPELPLRTSTSCTPLLDVLVSSGAKSVTHRGQALCQQAISSTLCMHVCVCVLAYVCVHTCMYRLEVNLSCYSLVRVSYRLSSKQNWQITMSQELVCPLLPSVGIRSLCHCAWFFLGFMSVWQVLYQMSHLPEPWPSVFLNFSFKTESPSQVAGMADMYHDRLVDLDPNCTLSSCSQREEGSHPRTPKPHPGPVKAEWTGRSLGSLYWIRWSKCSDLRDRQPS